jgi:putative Mg2+ transporter-C (MgtC) family protein
MISTQEIVVRLLAALLLCGVVGLQRALTGKAAGMRTHILVGVGAALFTLISGYAFRTSPSNTDRIAAQIVSGIGFIGGGAILKERGSIRGLTTAAGLWAAAALGMAAGAGLYVMGIAADALILLTLVGLRYVELRFPRRALESWAIDVTLGKQATVEQLHAILAPGCRKIALLRLAQGEETSLTFGVEVPRKADIVALSNSLRAAGARTVTWHAQGDADVEEGP